MAPLCLPWLFEADTKRLHSRQLFKHRSNGDPSVLTLCQFGFHCILSERKSLYSNVIKRQRWVKGFMLNLNPAVFTLSLER